MRRCVFFQFPEFSVISREIEREHTKNDFSLVSIKMRVPTVIECEKRYELIIACHGDDHSRMYNIFELLFPTDNAATSVLHMRPNNDQSSFHHHALDAAHLEHLIQRPTHLPATFANQQKLQKIELAPSINRDAPVNRITEHSGRQNRLSRG